MTTCLKLINSLCWAAPASLISAAMHHFVQISLTSTSSSFDDIDTLGLRLETKGLEMDSGLYNCRNVVEGMLGGSTGITQRLNGDHGTRATIPWHSLAHCLRGPMHFVLVRCSECLMPNSCWQACNNCSYFLLCCCHIRLLAWCGIQGNLFY